MKLKSLVLWSIVSICFGELIAFGNGQRVSEPQIFTQDMLEERTVKTGTAQQAADTAAAPAVEQQVEGTAAQQATVLAQAQ